MLEIELEPKNALSFIDSTGEAIIDSEDVTKQVSVREKDGEMGKKVRA